MVKTKTRNNSSKRLIILILATSFGLLLIWIFSSKKISNTLLTRLSETKFESFADNSSTCTYPTLPNPISAANIPNLLNVTINPRDTDSNITNYKGADGPMHKVMAKSDGNFRPELFVWLPGTNSGPGAYTKVMKIAASLGYRTVGLAYMNQVTIQDRCLDDTNIDNCHTLVMKETMYGQDLTSQVNVSRANSIENRLLKLLQYLQLHYPQGRWSDFYSNGVVNMNKIVVAGHSQGGSYTQFIGINHEVARAVGFSSAGTLIPDGSTYKLASWVLQPRRTPSSRIFAMYHEGETIAPAVPAFKIAMGLDIYGSTVNIDNQNYPFNCTHVLSMSWLPDGWQNLTSDLLQKQEHNSTAFDGYIPVDSAGIPVNTDAYIYLFTSQPR